jgi:hypothetical protein
MVLLFEESVVEKSREILTWIWVPVVLLKCS